MKIKTYGAYCLIVISCLMLISCGSGSSGTGSKGNTVYVTAGTKNGGTYQIDTATTSKSTASGLTYFNVGSLDYTINSTAYVVTSGIPASSVIIDLATISYVPVTVDSPPIASWTQSVGGSITPGGTLDLTGMTAVSTAQMAHLYPLFGSDPTQTFRYQVNVVFSGREVNSGTTVSTNAVTGNFFVVKGPIIVP